MSYDHQSVTQELVSAKYLVNGPECKLPESAEPERAVRVRREPPRTSGLEQAMRWISPLVLVLLLTAGIGLYFQQQASINSGLGRFRERTAGPIDFALWLGGSDQTLHERFKNKLHEVQRQSDAEWADMRAKMEKPLEFDSSNLVFPWTAQDDQ